MLVDRNLSWIHQKVFHVPSARHRHVAEEAAKAMHELVFKEHGWPLELISDRDAKFSREFWQELIRIVGTMLSMS